MTIRSHGLLASTQVYAFEPNCGLEQFFEDLAASWRGWKGGKKWSSLEGELSLVCTSDSLGHIAVEATLHSGLGEGWSVQNIYHVDAGQLDEIASGVKKFFALEAAI